jgi:DNA-binding SARP family transcriptional activator
MRICLLGEVSAHAEETGDDLLATLQPMLRLFAAVLAVEAGQPVEMARLEARLWDGYPPADPRGRLHTCAYRVRAALRGGRDADEGVIELTAGGYCLRVPRQAVDLHRFRAQALAARGLVGRDDEAACALARDALGEWGPAGTWSSGPEPLAGLTGRWAESYRRTLRRERRDVLIELAAAELRRGAADQVIAEFAEFAAADEDARDDQRLAAVLMRAYYRAGRQAEALRTYQDTIDSLHRKGVKPGKELQVLERLIRNQDLDTDDTSEFINAPRGLVPADGEQAGGESAEQAGNDTPVEGEGSGKSGVHADRFANDQNPRATYSQSNLGRTVIANQGTQHVNLGGTDE